MSFSGSLLPAAPQAAGWIPDPFDVIFDTCLHGIVKELAPPRTIVGGGGLILEEESSRMWVPELLPHLGGWGNPNFFACVTLKSACCRELAFCMAILLAKNGSFSRCDLILVLGF